MTLLASLRDLAEFRQVVYDLSDVLAQRALEDASALFRSFSRQTISLVEDDVVELEGNETRRLWLPERPVTDVSSLSITYDYTSASVVYATDAIWWSRRGLVKAYSGCAWGGTDATVHVTYSHGFADVPEDVKAVVLQIAARQLANPEGGSAATVGLTSASQTFAPVGLRSQEERVIEKYRPVARY